MNENTLSSPTTLMGGLFGAAGLSTNEAMVGAGISLLVLTWLLNCTKDFIITLFQWLKSRFYNSVRLSYPDQSFLWLLEWLTVQQVFGSRSYTVYTRYFDQSDARTSTKPDFKLLPTGTVWIRYKGYPVYIVRQSTEKRSIDGIKEDYLDLTILGGGKDLIEELIHTAMEYSINLNKDKTKVYSLEQHSQFWECISIQPKRAIESVILDTNISKKVIDDVDTFINGKEWYLNTGVPYRRGYLLYGPPGTGKTSFILSIAGKFGLNIGIMNMSKGINDGNIHSIIQKTPKETILVLEDIDAAFVQRKGNSDVLTFSGLLNALDGLASSDGRILIMTTNHLERLAPALIRPGRIDIKVKFDFASDFQISQMFKRFFVKQKVDQEIENTVIDRLGSHNVSTAQLQGWFIIHRDDPSALLDSIDDFLAQCEKEKKNSNGNGANGKSNSNNSSKSASPVHITNGNTKPITSPGIPDDANLLSENISDTNSLSDTDSDTQKIRHRSYVPTFIENI